MQGGDPDHFMVAWGSLNARVGWDGGLRSHLSGERRSDGIGCSPWQFGEQRQGGKTIIIGDGQALILIWSPRFVVVGPLAEYLDEVRGRGHAAA